MKRILSLAIGCLCFASISLNAADLKVAVVDMNRVLQEYYKTQQAEERLKEVAAGYQKELKDRREAYSKLVDQIRTLQEEARDTSLSEAKRKEKQTALAEKVKEAQVRERENVTFTQTATRLVQDQRNRATQNIMEEIGAEVEKVSKRSNYDLVLVKGDFPSPVLYSRVADLSDEIIKTLNKNAPKK